jgi:hypothetical protein
MPPIGYAHKISYMPAIAVPSDSTLLPDLVGVVCLTTGNCVINDKADNIITIPMVAGQQIRMSPKRIRAASTGSYLLLK